jgi:outer membrane immunogenic protein
MTMIHARAAEMEFKAPPPSPAGSWTGFYAGVNVGAGIGVSSDSQTAAFASPTLGANGLLSTADKHASPGAIAGGQVGHNWQLSPRWLFGIEGDWQWSSQKNASTACAPAASSVGFFGAGADGFGYCLSDESRINDLGTARVRGGMLVGDSLWYATGGFAWGRVRDDFGWEGSADATVFPGGLQPGPFLGSGTRYDKYRAGWTLGAGVETRLDRSWSAKLEYLYVDLGTISETLPIPINPVFGPAFASGGAMAARSSHVTDNIVRVGLNYHFSPLGAAAAPSPGLPLKAPPPPVLGWTGGYAGITAGGAIGVNADAQNASAASPTLGANGLLATGDKHAAPGAVAGAQIGYNRQLLSRWLVGIETDWQWTSQKNLSAACTPPASLALFGAGGNGFGYCLGNENRIVDFGTARARGGVLVGGSLWYATGGLAWGTVKDTLTFAGSANPTVFPGPLQPGPFLGTQSAFSNTRLGWTLGAGVETKLDSRWSAKLEYLYVDLGTVTETMPIPINPLFGPTFTGGGAAATRSSHITDNVVRAGVNYKLF